MSILPFQCRDHGIPGYNHYRAICNLTKVLEHNLILLYFQTLPQANGFDGLRREIAPPVIERLRRTYAHVNDIDLFSGNEERGWRASLGICWVQQRVRPLASSHHFPADAHNLETVPCYAIARPSDL